MKTRSIAAALAMPLAALLLVACGTTEASTGDDEAPEANDSADCADDATATGSGMP